MRTNLSLPLHKPSPNPPRAKNWKNPSPGKILKLPRAPKNQKLPSRDTIQLIELYSGFYQDHCNRLNPNHPLYNPKGYSIEHRSRFSNVVTGLKVVRGKGKIGKYRRKYFTGHKTHVLLVPKGKIGVEYPGRLLVKISELKEIAPPRTRWTSTSLNLKTNKKDRYPKVVVVNQFKGTSEDWKEWVKDRFWVTIKLRVGAFTNFDPSADE